MCDMNTISNIAVEAISISRSVFGLEFAAPSHSLVHGGSSFGVHEDGEATGY